jgi:amino acid transporter
MGSFTWNVTLSVVARLFYFGVISAALLALRWKQPEAPGLRLPAGPVLAVLGVLIAVVLAARFALTRRADLSTSLIVILTIAAALVNWLWARHANRVKA